MQYAETKPAVLKPILQGWARAKNQQPKLRNRFAARAQPALKEIITNAINTKGITKERKFELIYQNGHQVVKRSGDTAMARRWERYLKQTLQKILPQKRGAAKFSEFENNPDSKKFINYYESYKSWLSMRE